MPPRKRLRPTATPSKTRKGGRRTKQDDDELPQVYQEMLAEAARSSQVEEIRNTSSVKRRRISVERPEAPSPAQSPQAQPPTGVPVSSPAPSQESQRAQQTALDDFGSSEDESDVDFEDVAFGRDRSNETEQLPEQRSLHLDLSRNGPPQAAIHRRKPVSKAERDYRLNVHKTHLLLLLMNVQLRRRWCESEEVQAILKPLIPSKLRNMLHISEEKPDYQRSYSFKKAIEEICTIWRDEYEISGPGMRSASWREDVDAQKEADNFDDPSGYADFCAAAGTRHGSRDLGAMLFCALLRSAAVETRLVCSLQVLPFSAVAKGQTPEKGKSEYAYRTTWPSQELPIFSHEDPSNARWRQSEYAGTATPVTPARQVRKKVHDSPYPIFWVEVMLPTTHTWMPLDPLVRKTINKPKIGFEPPLSDSLNTMSYVIAFEEGGFAGDVTRRYAQFFNAKTRRQRVESTKHGDCWWTVTMQWFRRFKPMRSISDVLENKELENKSKNEPMPKNISDFKNHPVFALERHLRRNEAIWPNEHRGHFSAGNKDGKSEKVYHRKNVHIVRSADQWYRRGRNLKVGEHPLKRVTTHKRRGGSIDDEHDEEQDGTSLYAEFQTELYIPPPVVKGRIPKNQYGNLDVYVPTMIPPGAIHLQHPEARNAARILGVDFTDAVTGFKFKGRHGTAIINGIVVAAEYRDALVEVVGALEHERVREQEEKKSLIALAMWKKFMTALLIRQRIHEEHAEHPDELSDVEAEVAAPTSADEDSEYAESEDDAGGGFMPDADEGNGDVDAVEDVDLAKMTLDPEQATYHEVVVVESPHTATYLSYAANGREKSKAVPTLQTKDSLFDDDDAADDLLNGSDEGQPGGFDREGSETAEGGGFMVEDDASAGGNGGGYMLGEQPAEGGGFVPGDELADVSRDLSESTGDVAKESIQMNPSEVGSTSTTEAPSTRQQPPETSTELLSTPQGRPKDNKDNEDDDAASLLSHDPEDDDAEEAWAIYIDE